ncbi:dTDP-4-dehydrorhamnose reductase [Cohnella lubricantis]|uniref:dTDP-4-dehydrorhamnose reductase n=1 Tax=Cohnella lubricantis TaxID=2163172 RepID=A0A841TJX7_9BACL|nr:dTDP-4-dehydrorhamnose reductase [Cohnella lubricantis]MBB6678791.1 dTDP-4-dehydrorhamnose reductase [Cohnella lubricantis]MBP2117874.1 dTDP-4-dehydrorhamnose reductase [Cohnella lubricantis]
MTRHGTKLTLLVTGANGQLGQELIRMGDERIQLIGYGRDKLDITSLDQCRAAIAETKPDGIIHAAAYTAVDKAESEPDEAYRVNAVGTRNLAIAAQESGTKLCYVSTDYVFDGTGSAPYNEYDNTNPQSVYGKSKRAGEVLVQSLADRYFIVRTSWVYGKYGNNFVKTMLKLASERDQVTVVADQIGSPTYTRDLAKFLIELIQTEHYGIYHASNTGSCSWYEFARAIFEESGVAVRVEPCTTEQFPRPAPRPANSVMDHAAIRQNGLRDLPPWREALQAFLQELRK